MITLRAPDEVEGADLGSMPLLQELDASAQLRVQPAAALLVLFPGHGLDCITTRADGATPCTRERIGEGWRRVPGNAGALAGDKPGYFACGAPALPGFTIDFSHPWRASTISS